MHALYGRHWCVRGECGRVPFVDYLETFRRQNYGSGSKPVQKDIENPNAA